MVSAQDVEEEMRALRQVEGWQQWKDVEKIMEEKKERRRNEELQRDDLWKLNRDIYVLNQLLESPGRPYRHDYEYILGEVSKWNRNDNWRFQGADYFEDEEYNVTDSEDEEEEDQGYLDDIRRRLEFEVENGRPYREEDYIRNQEMRRRQLAGALEDEEEEVDVRPEMERQLREMKERRDRGGMEGEELRRLNREIFVLENVLDDDNFVGVDLDNMEVEDEEVVGGNIRRLRRRWHMIQEEQGGVRRDQEEDREDEGGVRRNQEEIQDEDEEVVRQNQEEVRNLERIVDEREEEEDSIDFNEEVSNFLF